MTKFDFDAELRGSDGTTLPVYCEVQLPNVGGQKAMIRLAVPAQYLTERAPENPCFLSGKSGAVAINMQELHWRSFPTSSRGALGLEFIELLHIKRLIVSRTLPGTVREIRFHLAPISFLRKESGFVCFGDKSMSEDLFILDLPGLGGTRFVAEWTTTYHRDAEVPGATVVAGFSAVANLPTEGPIDVDEMVAKFKSSLEVLSVLFRQAVTLHGWTYTDRETVSTWIAPLAPNITPSAHEDRGDFVALPQAFAESATKLVHAYGNANKRTRSLVRHLSVAVNPHRQSRTEDHFLFMFSALERVIESALWMDQTADRPAIAKNAVDELLKRLQKSVAAQGGEDAAEISARIEGLIGVVNRPSVRDKFGAFFRVYPLMVNYCGDIWPILGSGKERGLREIRNAMSHGRGSFVSLDVVSVAEWHLAILLERVIFVLLGMDLPDGISPGSFSLRIGGRGWYERDLWIALQSKPDQSI